MWEDKNNIFKSWEKTTSISSEAIFDNDANNDIFGANWNWDLFIYFSFITRRAHQRKSLKIYFMGGKIIPGRKFEMQERAAYKENSKYMVYIKQILIL